MIDIMENRVIGPAIRHGIEQGIPKGMRSVLSRQLTVKFGPLPHRVVAQLDEATEDELLGCAERVLTAATLDEVLAPAIAQAVERGERLGVRWAVSRVLMKKFGPLPDHTTARLDRSTTEELLDCVDRVFTAAALNEVFG
jgi:hypothetical protein